MGIEHIARVNQKYFAAIEQFAAKQDVRYYLCGVYIEPHHEKGVVIVGTNGHMMGVFHDPDGECKRPIIVGGITPQLLKACGNKRYHSIGDPKTLFIGEDYAVISNDNDAPESPFSKTAVFAGRIELMNGKFPDWRKVMLAEAKSAEVSEKSFCLNAMYISVFERVCRRLGLTRWAGLVIHPGKQKGGAAFFRIEEADISERFLGLIMKARFNTVVGPVPDSLKASAAQEAANV